MSYIRIENISDILDRFPSIEVSTINLTGKGVTRIPYQMPRASLEWERIGEAVGISGYEVKAICDYAFKNPMAIAAFEKFLIIAKLVTSEQMTGFYDKQAKQRAAYEENENRRIDNIIKKNHYIQKELERKNEVQSQIRRRWIKLMRSIHAALRSVNCNYNALDGEDKIFMRVLKAHGLANITNGVCALDMETAVTIDLDVIQKITNNTKRKINALLNSSQ